MSLSYSTLNPAYSELSPCRVTFKGVDLGGTTGNVIIKPEDMTAPIKYDQLGETNIDFKISGFNMTIETNIAEVQLKDNWKVVFPTHKLVSQGGQKLMYFDSTVGAKLSDSAGLLTLHPLSKPNSDLSGDVSIWLAVAEGKSQLTFSPKDQQILKIVWHVLPDFNTIPPRFFAYGDLAVGLVAASHGTATAGSNTGNGTVGSISVFSGVTKTETITLTALSATKFDVEGSLSGPLGIATTGVAFNSPDIALTITAGGTAFVANDSFTISTVAANYA